MLIGTIWLTALIVALAVLVGLLVIVLAMLSLCSRRPSNLGAIDGFLRDCPDTCNCVCSQAARADQRIAPIDFAGSADEALAKLKTIIAGLPRARLAAEKDRYLHFECTSRMFRLVDDLEFLSDPERRVIHCRSASRVRGIDFGVNRRRIEVIRRVFAARE